jgi:malate dehydrogenase (oxaloacetate-decarboxylating)
MSPAKHDPQANLLPPLVRSRELSFHVAMAVAKQALADGLAAVVSDQALSAAIKAKMWEPVYADYVRLKT